MTTAGNFWHMIGVISNALIVAAYFLLGLSFARRLIVISPWRWAGSAIRGAGAVFFLACALTHAHLTIHAVKDGAGPNQVDVGQWFDQWHGHLAHHPQAIAGIAFWVIFRFFSDAVVVGNREDYLAAVDQRIQERISEASDR